jgi:hypothetical protein
VLIYLDSSVVLAQLLAENRQPATALWNESLTSSQLLKYEVWNRIHFRGLTATHGDEVREFISGLPLMELTPDILARALEPFPVPVRTLDALHLASMDYARDHGQAVALASYDRRMITGARALGIELYDL